jgi:hypothetical protein
MHWEGCGKKGLWRILGNFLSISLKGLGKTAQNLRRLLWNQSETRIRSRNIRDVRSGCSFHTLTSRSGHFLQKLLSRFKELDGPLTFSQEPAPYPSPKPH